VVYRGGDALSGWAKSLIDMLGYGVALIALVGALCAALWGLLGWYLGGRADRGETGTPAAEREVAVRR